MNEGKLFINGQWRLGDDDLIVSINPGTNEPVWQGNGASREIVDQSIDAAQLAFSSFSQLDLQDRIRLCENFANLVDEHKNELAKIVSNEMGKPFWEALTEVGAMKAKIAISVDAYKTRTGSKHNQIGQMTQSLRHKPHGVLAVFGPYNFPCHLPNGHIVPALIAGNCVIFKPSELTPHSAEFTVKLWQKAGLPDGVLQLVQGQLETAKYLAAHPGLNGLLFTGSVNTGQIINKQFASMPDKILALEMGGNNPLIVRSTSNLQAVCYTIIQSAFITSGQRCTCARRLYIEDNDNGDAIVDSLVKMTKNIHYGVQNQQPEPFMGPVVSNTAASQLKKSFDKLIDLNGVSLTSLDHKDENLGIVSPGIVDVSDICALVDEEYFGPLLQLIRYSDFDQAIEMANNTRFGLAAGLLGGDEKDYQYFLSKIRAGIVNWNTQTTGASSNAPFGGVGLSGNHRPSAYYAADYCAYPVASLESQELQMPENITPGLTL